MKLGKPCDDRLPWIRIIEDLRQARAHSVPGVRLEALRKAGRALGDSLRGGPRVVGVKTLDNATLPYPTRFAFNGVVPLPWPMVIMTHRTLLVQIQTEDGVKSVLFNPTDAERSSNAPFFAKLRARINKVAPFAERLLTRDFASLEDQLRTVGIEPGDIDVIAFDHFHTQDLRHTLGSDTTAARFPNALLLAPRREWEDWDALHPMQRAWFIEDGKKGVPADRVVLTDDDLALGEGCLLLQTPGHTTGNQTLFVHGEDGVFGCSENGTSADSYSPHASPIPGLKRFAKYYELEVVLNANTPELGGEQYISMILERSIVDPAKGRPDFVQMFPSSEVTATALAPRISPAMVFKHKDSGRFAR
jgi:glyoxylase-like metal-dependent hydrolase (beta-lactamase superfamily II)